MTKLPVARWAATLPSRELTIIDTDVDGVEASPDGSHGAPTAMFRWTVPSGITIVFDPMNKDCGVYFDNPESIPVQLIQVMITTAVGRRSRVWQGTPRSSGPTGSIGIGMAHRWQVAMAAESGDVIEVQCPTVGAGSSAPDAKHIHLYVMSTGKLSARKKPDPPSLTTAAVNAEMDRQEMERARKVAEMEQARKVCGAAILVNGKPSACQVLNCTEHERVP